MGGRIGVEASPGREGRKDAEAVTSSEEEELLVLDSDCGVVVDLHNTTPSSNQVSNQVTLVP